jgi:hypothetical protein
VARRDNSNIKRIRFAYIFRRLGISRQYNISIMEVVIFSNICVFVLFNIALGGLVSSVSRMPLLSHLRAIPLLLAIVPPLLTRLQGVFFCHATVN